ncbi:ABC transporter ATP-binding protein [Alicyclobacillus cycloheptanicus]|uniref:Peptide/nickel transport system ATP-binding protein n=1 Tax=Alicyclobacillus cycloheptanicus TaxID=1457 RepID=A0ABT9XG41_9BACL|nr:ABC transporter ATP-binding protein [Alicyclobacillus cycloheptanicus]MDQ0189049.1 peptide/nickel transport system ATP-binding protein [Alicyclobacillus cycloheptanicus]WDM00186.1 ABC transporter ATP-binding protein [Alicyclobacillus cycloheptanicus]
MNSTVVLEVSNLTTKVQRKGSSITLVDDVSFRVHRGEVLGVVGESGCGKSVTALSVMGLIKPPVAVTSGAVLLNGQNLVGLPKAELRRMRGSTLSMIFQEPMTSLNPVFSVGNQLSEVLRIHKHLSKRAAFARSVELLKLVGIPRPEEVAKSYPHQLSGGMRQRVMIAMAMACEPGLLIADEPTTALDVTIQAQILQIMKNLQQTMGLTMMLITHDFGVVSQMCDKVIVMYAGKIVESGDTQAVLHHPAHPYTKGLLNSLPERNKGANRLKYIPGSVPPPAEWGLGCRFADRCEFVEERCRVEMPPLFSAGQGEQRSRCWLSEKGGGRHA